eukprot:NODE_13374_length_1169_cov_7.308061.p1 GENE.NODE_13374_length_1169_cov_7.308061~~NODE_13374_length_1169_cov_7.308061.p1  ORF type:complete len:285 (-),score=74.95 NODE_13374_length_1169_cov_7.308061:313-1074(-)
MADKHHDKHTLIEEIMETAEEVIEVAEEVFEVAIAETELLEAEFEEIEEEVYEKARKTWRWLAYTARMNAIAGQGAAQTMAASGAMRYLAFASDFGEAFRPAVPPGIVNAAYGLSIAYIVGAIAESGYEVRKKSWPIFVETVAHETSFQLLASLLVPFLFIHSAVHKTAQMCHACRFHKTRPLIAKYTPSAVGIACVPLLPVFVDHPCEYVVDEFFDKAVKPYTRSWGADCMKQQSIAEKNSTKVQKYTQKVE